MNWQAYFEAIALLLLIPVGAVNMFRLALDLTR